MVNRLPRWLIRWLAKVIFLPTELMSLLIKVEVRNEDKIPKPGKYILCTTHPGLFDQCFIKRVLRDRENYFMFGDPPKSFALANRVAQEYFKGPIVIGNSMKIQTLRDAIAYLSQGKPLIIASSGTPFDHPDKDKPFVRPGPTYLACKTNSPIYPVIIENGVSRSYRDIERFHWYSYLFLPVYWLLIPFRHWMRYRKQGGKVTLVFKDPIYPDLERYRREGRKYVEQLTQRLGEELGVYTETSGKGEERRWPVENKNR